MKLRYLDGLRGYAAFVVLLHHFAFIFFPYAVVGEGVARYGMEWVYQTPLYLLVAGDFAVCLFFVLSGVVLSAKYFRTHDREVVIATAAKRYIRLGLPVFGSIMIGYGLMRLGLIQTEALAGITGSSWWASFWDFRPELGQAMKQGFWALFKEGNNLYNFPLWTMRIELFGSFLVFLTLLAFGALRNRWIFYALLLVIFLNSYYAAFILGIMLCDFGFSSSDNRLKVALRQGWWLPLMLGSLVLASWPLNGAEGSIFGGLPLKYSNTARVYAAFGVILSLMYAHGLQRLLETKVSQFMGRISFSLYLLHAFVMATYTGYLFPLLPSAWSYPVRVAVTFVPTVLLTFAISYLYARYVDEQAIRLSGLAYRRLFRRSEQTEKVTAFDEPLAQVTTPVVFGGKLGPQP